MERVVGKVALPQSRSEVSDASSRVAVNDFTIQREHEQICPETYELLSAMILWEPSRRKQYGGIPTGLVVAF
jgi:hypothetical protein